MSLDDDIGRILSEYRSHEPRDSLEPVWRLRRALPPPAEGLLRVGVVGTNGKTSVATYLSRLLTAAGARTGLYSSPHLNEWTERVRIDGSPCGGAELLAAVTEVHELARSELDDLGGLRFFDVLTLAAERLIGQSGARFGVFEAGIGGRLDAVRVLEPRLVLLTSVSIDHAEMLGNRPSDILREKLLVAPPDALVGSLALADDLVELGERIASEHRLRLVWIDPDQSPPPPGSSLPAYLHAALVLARWGLDAAGDLARAQGAPLGAAGPLSADDLWLPGRLERGEFEAVPYVLDAAHNQGAWMQLRSELARSVPAAGDAFPLTALISVSPGKQIDDLPEVLNTLPELEQVIVTSNETMPSIEPRALAAALEPRVAAEVLAVENARSALTAAFEHARRASGGVLVFGSTHLIGTVRRLLAEAGEGRSQE